jgi:hypothetical protein
MCLPATPPVTLVREPVGAPDVVDTADLVNPKVVR